MKKFLLAITCLATVATASANTPSFLWGSAVNANYESSDKFLTSTYALSPSSDNCCYAVHTVAINGTVPAESNPTKYSWLGNDYEITQSTAASNARIVLIHKYDAQGNILWSAYNTAGQSKTGNILAETTSDNGVVVAIYSQHANASFEEGEPLLTYIDGKGNSHDIAGPANNDVKRYSLVIMKFTADGELAWSQWIEQSSTVGDVTNVTDFLKANSMAIDAEDNIYIGGAYLSALTFPGNVIIPTALNVVDATKTQTSQGDAFIVKLDAQGNTKQVYYAGLNNSAAYATIDQVSGLAINGDNLYVAGTTIGSAEGTANILGSNQPVRTYTDIYYGKLSTADITAGASYLNRLESITNSKSKVVLYVNDLKFIDNNLYFYGRVDGGLNTPTPIETGTTWQQGYFVKASAADGTITSAGITSASNAPTMPICDAATVFDNTDTETISYVGYAMSGGLVLQEFPYGYTVSNENYSYLLSGNGTFGVQCATLLSDGKTLIGAARSNKDVTFLSDDNTTGGSIWAYTTHVGAWSVDGLSGAEQITIVPTDDTNAPAEYYNLQGMRIAAPVAGQVTIMRRGTTVTKFIAH